MVKLIAAIGNFDGVHRGHRQLLEATARIARSHGASPAAVVFEPHPRRYFQPDAPPFLLTTPSKREALLLESGAQKVLTLTFDEALAQTSAKGFVGTSLKRRLNLAGVVVGSEFRFGKGREGDAEGLCRLCDEVGLVAVIVEPAPEGEGGEKIGSSAIRAAIAAGDIRGANAMLGRRWSVEGVVLPGQKLGRTLGFPTANLTLGPVIEPRRGVYAISARVKGASFGGVANFGRRPTVGAPTPLLEAHLFDFSGDLYGQVLEVSFVDFIRDEQKFDGLLALTAQIAADAEAARAIFLAAR